MEKQKITVRLGGKSYTLVSSDPPEYLRRVAELADRKIREMEITTGLPSVQAMTLTCLNLEDQLVRAQDEIRELKRRLEAAEKGRTDKAGH